LSEHIALQDQQGAEGWFWVEGHDLLTHRQVPQKRLDFCASRVIGMALLLEENVPFDPGDIRLLSMKRRVLESDGIVH
jgi:hypothetical protein